MKVLGFVGGAVCTAALLNGCLSIETVTRKGLDGRFVHVRNTNFEGPNTIETFWQSLLTTDDPETPEDETRWGELEPGMVANGSGIGSSVFQSASYVWGQSARRPDQVNISQSGGGANSESSSEADASARASNRTKVGVNVKVHQNQNQGQKQGQQQGQKQGQLQGQKNGGRPRKH